MSWLEALAVILAGIAAGTINTIVGSGTLVTFPTLVLLGVPPVTANISNNLGLVPGSFTAAWGYRGEMVGARDDLRRIVPASLVGGVLGALLVLVLDPAWFRAIVPVLIGLGILLVVFGKRLNAWASRHHEADSARRWRLLQGGVGAAGVYGGYFGAAQGVILMGILSSLTDHPLQRLNGYKNVCASVVNSVAAVVFLALAWSQIHWVAVGLIAIGSVIGGVIGSTVGRRIPPDVLRAVIVVVGLIAIVRLVWFA